MTQTIIVPKTVVNKMVLPMFEIPIQKMVEEFAGYNKCFFFYKRGVLDVLDRALEINMRIRDKYQPASFNEFNGLKADVLQSLEAYADRHLRDSTLHPDMLDLMELAVEQIDEQMLDIISNKMPPCSYTIRKKEWVGVRCFVDLELE